MTCPIVKKRQILEHLLMTSLYSTFPILYRVCIFLSHNRESSVPYLKLLDVLNIEIAFLY